MPRTFLLLTVLLVLIIGCTSETTDTKIQPGIEYTLTEVATSEHQWTGISVGPDGRTFVNFPRWSEDIPMSVGVLKDDGNVQPYPNEYWNSWEEGLNPDSFFVCVQSVVVDDQGFLWVLDPANPMFQGVVEGGAKLLKISPETGKIIERYDFDSPFVQSNSYLNDVRIDTRRGFAFITDSGNGALVIVDLNTGEIRRVLDDHPSTHAEDITLTFDGQPWVNPDGSARQVHADGIALHPSGDTLFYQALTGRTMYKIATEWLRNFAITDTVIAQYILTVGETGPSDGLLYGPDGRIWITAITDNALKATTTDGNVSTIVQDSLLAWPDTYSMGPDSMVYVTTAQIHLQPNPPGPYRIFRIAPAAGE